MDLVVAFFNDRLNVITVALLGLLAFGVWIAFFTELKEEPRKRKS